MAALRTMPRTKKSRACPEAAAMATAIADGEQPADGLLHALPPDQPEHEDQERRRRARPRCRSAGRRARWPR